MPAMTADAAAAIVIAASRAVGSVREVIAGSHSSIYIQHLFIFNARRLC